MKKKRRLPWKPVHCTDCGGKKHPEDFKRGEYCPCCEHHD